MAEENKAPVTALQDLIAGGIAGTASVVVGHPFDTYKVRLQTSAYGTKQSLNISNLFKGMGPPLSTAAVVNALIFSSYGESSRLYDQYFTSQGKGGTDEDNASTNGNTINGSNDDSVTGISPWKKSFICGSFAGTVQALVICPTEHIKCRLQIQNNIGFKEQIFKGPFDAVDKILSSHGIRGLYRGFVCTGWREIPAFGLYFATYDLVKEKTTYILSKTLDGGTEKDEVPGNDLRLWAASSLAGGVSGAFTWATIYPFDVIKTKIQTSPINTPTEKTRMLYITRQIMKQHGWRFFFRGLGVTVMRAFPVNAIIFPTYELTLMQLTSNGFGTPAMNEQKI